MSGFDDVVARIMRARTHAPWQTAALQFGSDLTTVAVEAALGGVAGLSRGRAVAIELVATRDGIEHRLSSDAASIDTLRAVLRAALPHVRLTNLEEAPPRSMTVGALIGLDHRYATIAPAGAGVAAALLATLQPLGRDEAIVVRWLVMPAGTPPAPDRHEQDGRAPAALLGWAPGRVLSAEHARVLRTKHAGTMLTVTGVAAVSAGHPQRARHLLGRVGTVMRTVATPHGRLVLRPRYGRALERLLERKRVWRGGRMSPAELAGLLGWPIDAPRLPGVSLSASPVLMASRSIPQFGRRFARSNWSGDERELAQDLAGELMHTLIAGPTGSGKSALLLNLMAHDLDARRSVVVIDGKGDLAQDVLARIPSHRERDVVVLDLGADGPVPGLALFGRHSDPDLAADMVLGVFADLFADSWGPRSEQWLRVGLQTLARDPKATLADYPFLFSDAAYRRRLVGGGSDPLLASSWAAFEALSEAEKANVVGAPIGKVMSLIGRPRLRVVLGQSEPQLDLRDVIDRGRVLIVNLASGTAGAPAARLLGALVVYELAKATLGRASVAPHARRPAMVYIDEPQILGYLPVPLDTLLEQARGFGVGLTVAAQSVAQLAGCACGTADQCRDDLRLPTKRGRRPST